MKGWYKEQWRHSLASRGISTSKYFIRKRKLPKGVGPAQPIPKIRPIKPTEEFITDVFVRGQGEEVRKEVLNLRDKRQDLKEQLQDIKDEFNLKGENVSVLRARKREIDANLKDLDLDLTKSARAKLQRESESLDQTVNFIAELRKEQQDVLDRLDTLEGKDRGFAPPGVKTKAQLERTGFTPVKRPREKITKAERLESLEGRGRFQKRVEGGDKEDFSIATGFKGATRKLERATRAEGETRPGIAGAAVGKEAFREGDKPTGITFKEMSKRELRAREKADKKGARDLKEAKEELDKLRESKEFEDNGEKNGKERS